MSNIIGRLQITGPTLTNYKFSQMGNGNGQLIINNRIVKDIKNNIFYN